MRTHHSGGGRPPTCPALALTVLDSFLYALTSDCVLVTVADDSQLLSQFLIYGESGCAYRPPLCDLCGKSFLRDSRTNFVVCMASAAALLSIIHNKAGCSCAVRRALAGFSCNPPLYCAAQWLTEQAQLKGCVAFPRPRCNRNGHPAI